VTCDMMYDDDGKLLLAVCYRRRINKEAIMACMEHVCNDCGHAIFNNEAGPMGCPKCGGDMNRYFDEAYDDHGDDYYDGDEEYE